MTTGMTTDAVVHALLPDSFDPRRIPRGRFHGMVDGMSVHGNGLMFATLRFDGEEVMLRLGQEPVVPLMPGDFVIASYIGGRAVTFHRVERQETRTVIVHSDGTPP